MFSLQLLIVGAMKFSNFWSRSSASLAPTRDTSFSSGNFCPSARLLAHGAACTFAGSVLFGEECACLQGRFCSIGAASSWGCYGRTFSTCPSFVAPPAFPPEDTAYSWGFTGRSFSMCISFVSPPRTAFSSLGTAYSKGCFVLPFGLLAAGVSSTFAGAASFIFKDIFSVETTCSQGCFLPRCHQAIWPGAFSTGNDGSSPACLRTWWRDRINGGHRFFFARPPKAAAMRGF
ncbi:hypothetical protein Tsubulata_025417 [Turnera subulata]|uniref:Uncharacterized protein n=1 Tax=Turnera subulata TaxID=218843 RepID=A0A9Q0JLQ2_9ROSI|nr:hypothetical protein Tsubulata_025417 [Turnera subulata]